MGFTEADYLFAQENVYQGKRIITGRMSFAVVGGINDCERIPVRKDLIDPCGSKIFTNPLVWIAERFGDSARRSC